MVGKEGLWQLLPHPQVSGWPETHVRDMQATRPQPQQTSNNAKPHGRKHGGQTPHKHLTNRGNM